MHTMPRSPPKWVLDELYQLLPTLRLGWDGRRSCYSLIQLYRHREVYDKRGNNKTFREPWGERGEIFGRPFDRCFRVPIYVIDVQVEDLFVHTDFLLATIAGFCKKSLYRRLYEANMEQLKQQRAEQQALAEAQGELMYWRAMKSTWRPKVVAREFLTREDKYVLSGERSHDLAARHEAHTLGGPSPDALGVR